MGSIYALVSSVRRTGVRYDDWMTIDE